MFWQRKNARLTARLETLVESSERVRKSRRRKPSRVIIDQTYVQNPPERQADAYTEPHDEFHDDPAVALADDTQANDEARQDAAVGSPVVAMDEALEHETEESAILHEAIEQLDQAEQREAAALREIEQLRAEIEHEKAARLSLEDHAKHATDASQQAAASAELDAREAAARAELEDLRSALERVEAERHAAEERHQAAETRARAAEAAAVQHSSGTSLEEEVAAIRAEADARIAVARRDASAQRELLDQLRKDLFAAQAAEEEAEQKLTASEEKTAAAIAETEQHRAAADRLEESLAQERKSVELAERKAAATASDLEEQRQAVARLTQSLEQEREAVQTASERADKAEAEITAHLGRIEQLETALAEADEAAKAARQATETAKRTASGATAREEALNSELETLTTRAACLEAELAKAENAAQKAAKQPDKAAAKAAEAENALKSAPNAKDLSTVGKRAEQAEARESEAISRANDLAAKIEQLDTEMAALQARLETAEQKADKEAWRASALEDELAALRAAATADAGNAEVRDQALADREDARCKADALRAEVERLEDEIEVLRQHPATPLAAITAASPETAPEADAPVEVGETAASGTAELTETAASGASGSSLIIAGEPDDTASALAVSTLETASPDGAADEALSTEEARVHAAAERLAARLVDKSDKSDVPADPPGALRTKKRAASIAARADNAPDVASPDAPAGDRIQSRISKATAPKEKPKDKRRAKRVASRKLAQLWHSGMNAGLSCTMLDRSSTGAKLEVVTDRFNDRMNDISVGDRFTLVLTSAQERTTMPCEIMWVAGKRCGVAFCGQIRTEILKTQKKAMPKEEPEKPTAAKKLKSLFGSNAG